MSPRTKRNLSAAMQSEALAYARLRLAARVGQHAPKGAWASIAEGTGTALIRVTLREDTQARMARRSVHDAFFPHPPLPVLVIRLGGSVAPCVLRSMAWSSVTFSFLSIFRNRVRTQLLG
ncbi:MAG TPA: hypothetical protein VH601_12170 [Bryobacteraceae bacterium]